MSEPTKMRVHRNGVPAYVQVNVHPGGAAVDYLDDDDNIVISVVHDIASIEGIAATKGLEVVEVDHGGVEAQPPTTVAAERNAAEAAGEPLPEPIEADSSFMDVDLDELSVDELKEKLRAAGLAVSGNKAALIERLREAD